MELSKLSLLLLLGQFPFLIFFKKECFSKKLVDNNVVTNCVNLGGTESSTLAKNIQKRW